MWSTRSMAWERWRCWKRRLRNHGRRKKDRGFQIDILLWLLSLLLRQPQSYRIERHLGGPALDFGPRAGPDEGVTLDSGGRCDSDDGCASWLARAAVFWAGKADNADAYAGVEFGA